MSYSFDLRRRVVLYVQDGGTKISASRQFKVSLWCVNDWCSRVHLEPNKPPGRPRKIDWDALATDIQKHPDKLLRDVQRNLASESMQFGMFVKSLKSAIKKH